MEHKVTEKAMRPASSKRECFYCHEPIGGYHGPECVLVKEKVKIALKIDVEVEYEIDVPAHWNAEDIEFRYNGSSWCANNDWELIKEAIRKKYGCLCFCAEATYIETIPDSEFCGE